MKPLSYFFSSSNDRGFNGQNIAGPNHMQPASGAHGCADLGLNLADQNDGQVAILDGAAGDPDWVDLELAFNKPATHLGLAHRGEVFRVRVGMRSTLSAVMQMDAALIGFFPPDRR